MRTNPVRSFAVTLKNRMDAVHMVENSLEQRIQQHGCYSYAGPHEAFGVIWEEFIKEAGDALHANDHKQFYSEMIDVAVGAIFAIASDLALKENAK